jgi:hypothetical protein
MKASGSFETSVSACQSTRRHIAVHHTLKLAAVRTLHHNSDDDDGDDDDAPVRLQRTS